MIGVSNKTGRSTNIINSYDFKIEKKTILITKLLLVTTLLNWEKFKKNSFNKNSEICFT